MANIRCDHPITLSSIRKDLEHYFTEHLEIALSMLNDSEFQNRIELLVEEWCDAFEADAEDHLSTVLDFLELYLEKCNAATETDEEENGSTSHNVIELS